MTATPPPLDDLEAVRTIVGVLKDFPADDRERILRWVREKLGLEVAPTPSRVGTTSQGDSAGAAGRATDIKSFIAQKAPQIDTHFAAAVAYYYRFEAPEAERADEIGADALQDAARKAGRSRLPLPIVTLHNAVKRGLLDKGSRGKFCINTVGENLVAMALPGAAGEASAKAARKSGTRKVKSKK